MRVVQRLEAELHYRDSIDIKFDSLVVEAAKDIPKRLIDFEVVLIEETKCYPSSFSGIALYEWAWNTCNAGQLLDKSRSNSISQFTDEPFRLFFCGEYNCPVSARNCVSQLSRSWPHSNQFGWKALLFFSDLADDTLSSTQQPFMFVGMGCSCAIPSETSRKGTFLATGLF